MLARGVFVAIEGEQAGAQLVNAVAARRGQGREQERCAGIQKSRNQSLVPAGAEQESSYLRSPGQKVKGRLRTTAYIR